MIHYVIGDATQPVGDGRKTIVHVCNDIGGWGRGFVVALSKRWSQPETIYRQAASNRMLDLGRVLSVKVTSDTWVSNMIAQHDVRTIDGVPPIRYDALRNCLTIVATQARTDKSSIHMPRIGCGLAGGEWSKVEALINELMNDLQIYVYDLPDNPIPFNP